MKKLSMFIAMLALCLAMLGFSSFAVECSDAAGANEGAQNYERYASPNESYLAVRSDGTLMRVQYIAADGTTVVECYDSSYNIKSRKVLEQELPIFGGFYAGENGYYILTGQSNPKESASAEVFRITKYDKNWNRLSSAGLFGANTTVPFDAGSARFAESGDYLIVRTCHEMYKHSDGYNHQANVTIQLNTKTMKITSSFTDVLNCDYGYVSHSFNQFVKIENDSIIAVDHGDAGPRSIALLKYKTKVSSGNFVPTYSQTCQVIDMLKISGKSGDNYTGCSVGGFEISDSSYIVAISSIDQSNFNLKTRNIYLSVLSKNSSTPSLKKITDYKEGSESAGTPHLVKITNNRFILLWSVGDTVNYIELDGKGNKTKGIYSFSGSLSDCLPIVYSNKLVWYTWRDGAVTFYDINLNNPESRNIKAVEISHNFTVTSSSGTTVNLKCSKCGAVKSGKVPSSFTVYWEDLERGGGWYISPPASLYHPGVDVKLQVDFISATFNEYELTSSDDSVVKIIYNGGSPVAKMVGEGTVKVTVKSKYSPSVKAQYTVNVAHNWVDKGTKAATCTDNGSKSKQCKTCSVTENETIPALGHKLGNFEVKQQATCKAVGKESAQCSRCSYTENRDIPKLSHDKKQKIEAIAATCTASGKTEGKKCSMCGTVTVSQETVPALGHNLGKYEITKASTCTAMGEETAKCTRCSYTKTQDVPRTSHKETTVAAVEPTCTKSGKTHGKKCSVCGKITDEQESVPALGHNLGKYEITKAPTCTAMGEETAKCTRCSYTKTQDVPRTSHKETTVAALEPTCTKTGKTQGKKCSVCGKITDEQDTVPALGHSLGEYKVTKAATCTATGKKTAQCKRCDYTTSETISKVSHDSKTSIKAVAATCTASGKTEGKKCSMCGTTTVKQETVPALGHSLGEYKVTKAATCTATGKKTAQCKRCDYTKSETISKVSHDSKTSIKAVAATCTASGKTEGKKCSMCGTTTVKQETVPSLGHDLGAYKVTKKATCTAQGEETAECSRCSYSKSRSTERIAHSEVEIKAVLPTCTKQGKTEGKKCSVCGKITDEQESVPALGHDLGAYKVTKAATCTAQGEKEAKCSRCSYSKSDTIARITHTEITVEGTEPTCTKQGKTEGKKCCVCGRVTLEQKSIASLGHSEKVTVEVAATKDKHGTVSTVCTRCGKDSGNSRIYKIASVSLSKTRYAYDGKAKKPTVTVKDSQGKVLVKDTDYTVKYQSGRKNVGKYSVKVTFKGKYSDSEDLAFTVIPAKTSEITATQSTTTVKLTWSKVKGATGYRVYKYNTKTKEYEVIASVKGKNTYTIKNLKAGTAYKVAVKSYTKLDGGEVFWSSAAVKTETSTSPSAPTMTLKSSAKKTAEISWKKVSGATGYQIYYSTGKNGEYKKLTSLTKLAFKKTGLTSGKTYYFKVRAYKKTATGTAYGGFSSVKSVKIK